MNVLLRSNQKLFSNFVYSEIASSISLILMYSSAVWEREDSPGPSLSDGKRIKAWSLNVGEPNGFKPSLMQACTKGCSTSIFDEDRRKERAFKSEVRCS